MPNRKNSASPLIARSRVKSLDALRGVALFGVLLANLEMMFRVPAFAHWVRPDTGAGLDQLIRAVLSSAIHVKMLMLFTILLGFGLAMQSDTLVARGNGPSMLYRRMFALLAFGLIHLFLIWNGDILTEYAMAGLLLIPLLRLHLRGLIIAFFGCLALYVLFPMAFRPFRLPSIDALSAHVDAAGIAYGQGDYLAILSFRIGEILRFGPLNLYQLPRTLAMLLLGAMLWRLGALRLFTEPHRLTAIAGLLLAVAGFALCQLPGRSGALMNATVGSTLVALGYAAVFAQVASLPSLRSLVAWSSAVGRMAFTNYLLASVILGIMFYGYGFGLMGQITTTTGLLIGAGIYAVFVIGSVWWLKQYPFGPIEWIWRRLSLGGRVGWPHHQTGA